MSSTLKRVTFEDLFKKMKEVGQLNHARTEKLYIEMHREALSDLICSPDLDSYVGTGGIYDITAVEKLLNCRIFTHEDSSKRFIITITYRADVIMGEDNNG